MNWFEKNTELQTLVKFDKTLERFKNACIEAGSPHLKMKNVIHIAGTNGKGSTIAFLKSILKEARFKVNSTTSPHLIKFNERINLNGENISDEYLNRIYQQNQNIMNKYNLSFFEKAILTAFTAFAQSDADFNIIEVGLGGTLDATNVIENPKICVITSIGLDHCAILGDTLEQIATNKADIIKSNAKVVIGYNSKNVIDVIKKNKNNLFYVGGKDWFLNKTLKLSLAGEHQYYNAANALAICDLLKQEFNIPNAAIINGLKKTFWPARMQKIGNVIIDGAHNIDGINALMAYLKNINGTKIGIMTVMKDKNIDQICKAIGNAFEVIYCVPLSGAMRERALQPNELVSILESNKINAEYVCDFRNIINLNKQNTVVIFGSLFLVGQALDFLRPTT